MTYVKTFQLESELNWPEKVQKINQCDFDENLMI